MHSIKKSIDSIDPEWEKKSNLFQAKLADIKKLKCEDFIKNVSIESEIAHYIVNCFDKAGFSESSNMHLVNKKMLQILKVIFQQNRDGIRNMNNFIYEFDRILKNELDTANISYTHQQVDVIVFHSVDIIDIFLSTFG